MRTAISIVSLVVACGCAGLDSHHKSETTGCDTVLQKPTLFQRMGFGARPDVRAEGSAALDIRSTAKTGFVPARSTSEVTSEAGGTVVIPKLPSGADES
jgi:hypothetical protein